MSDINKLVFERLRLVNEVDLQDAYHKYKPLVKPMLKQAGVWGAGGLASNQATKDHDKPNLVGQALKLHKKEELGKNIKSAGAGALAGAIGTVI